MFYLKNQISNSKAGFVGIFRYSATPGDTTQVVTDVWQTYEFTYRLCEDYYRNLITKPENNYVSYTIVDLECSECRKEDLRQYIKAQ